MSRAVLKFIRLSPTKARLIAREVQGMNAELALASLEFTPNKAAGIIAKVIASACANGDFEPEEVEIVSCRVDKGPVLKRFRPRARGSASRILKPTSHIIVEVAPSSEKKDKGTSKPTKKVDSKENSKATKSEKKSVESKAKESKTTTEKQTKSKKIDLTDLKLLSGVGPAVERSLNAHGVSSVEQIANMNEDELKNLDENIGIKGDIAKSWPSEAKELVEKSKKES